MSQFKRLFGIVVGSLMLIVFGYLAFKGLSSSLPLVGYASIAMMAFLAFILLVGIKGQPPFLRYEARAKRHQNIDPEQAYADFTKAIRLAPWSHTAYQGRSSLYDKVGLSTEDLSEEIEFMAKTLKTTGRSRQKLREELAKAIIELSTMRVNREREAGLANESIGHILQLLDFMESNVADIHQFKTPTASFGTGVTLHLRGELRKNIQKTRTDLYQAGLVQAVGFCRRCKEEVEPDPELYCSRDRSHGKLEKVRFFVADPSIHRAQAEATRIGAVP
jgi:hypothetical protein